MREVIIRLGQAHLLEVTSDSTFSGYGVSITRNRGPIAICRLPIALQRFDGAEFTWIRAGYTEVREQPNGLRGTGRVPIGKSTAMVSDEYEARDAGLSMRRTVTVKGSTDGVGFLSAFEWNLPDASLDDPWFVPGLWYNRNRFVPGYAVGAPESRSSVGHVVFREDRLSLPLVMRYSERDESALAVTHVDADPQTVAADDNDAPLVDHRLGFGSFGMYEQGRTLAFWFPGTEGELFYAPMWTIGRGNDQSRSPINPFTAKAASSASRGWVFRYHPLRNGFVQRYTLVTSLLSDVPYHEARDRAWSAARSSYRPRPRPVELSEIERTNIALLERLVKRDTDAIGIPTWIDCFTGRPGELQNTFGIGFVARNLEIASVLIAAGYRGGDESKLTAGREIVDFWTDRGGAGLSHTEYDPQSRRWVDGGQHGEGSFVFLRDQSEARRTCLDAWALERERGVNHPQWLAWVRSYAEWLRDHQNADGSYFRAYDLDGTPALTSRADCAHAVTFLIAYSRASDDPQYRTIASRVAEYLWEHHHRFDEYVGGTLDNPTCYDKEAAALAFEAYLSLFQATGERRWLESAERAARVCETWVIQWNIPAPIDERADRFFRRDATTVGFQLITTGFSAFDIYLTRHVGDFARLARYTGDGHYAELARLLLYNTKCTVQTNHEYGYAFPGFQIEHWSIGRGRGYGLNSGWLPWVATSHVISIDRARAERLE